MQAKLLCLVAAMTVAAGCAAPVEEPERSGATTSALSMGPNDNCQRDKREGVYDCWNLHAMTDFRPGAYMLLNDLDAWKNERAIVGNEGQFGVTVFITQGFNKSDGFIHLARGEKVVMTRRDEIWPNYNLLIYPDDGVPEGAVQLHVERWTPGGR